MKTNGKGVFFVMIGSVIVLVVLYFLIKSIIKQVGKTETEKANEDEVDNVNNELSDSCSGNYTFDDSAYLTKANTLHDALDGCGTDDSEIDSVFQSLDFRDVQTLDFCKCVALDLGFLLDFWIFFVIFWIFLIF